MKVNFVARVIDLYKSADPKYPNTSVTLLEAETKSTILVKLVPADAGKVVFDQRYTFDGEILAQKANNAFGACYLTFKEGVKITVDKTQ